MEYETLSRHIALLQRHTHVKEPAMYVTDYFHPAMSEGACKQCMTSCCVGVHV